LEGGVKTHLFMNTLQFLKDKYQLKGNKAKYELYCRRKVSFPRLFNQLGYKVGVEVGVGQGRFTKEIAIQCPDMKIYGVDAWKLHFGLTHHETQDDMEHSYDTAKWRLAPYKNIELTRGWSVDVVKEFEDNSLDFVYIDAAHSYKNVTEDIKVWSKKVRSGGLVMGHDYTDPIPDRKKGYYKEVYDVKHAVNDWVKKNKIKPLFIFVKDDPPSWFYVK